MNIHLQDDFQRVYTGDYEPIVLFDIRAREYDLILYFSPFFHSENNNYNKLQVQGTLISMALDRVNQT